MDFSTFVPDILSNLISAAIAGTAVVILWPSRREIWAWARARLPIKDVGLYLSHDGSRWNIEVPPKVVNDVRWRLKRYRLTPTSDTSTMTADDYTEAFDLTIAAHDQSYADDVIDITAAFKEHRISIYVVGDVSGPHSTAEIDELFS